MVPGIGFEMISGEKLALLPLTRRDEELTRVIFLIISI